MAKLRKSKKPPSAAQMKRFAQKFFPSEWKDCCESSSFLQAVCDDLRAAEYIAVKILQDEWQEPGQLDDEQE